MICIILNIFSLFSFCQALAQSLNWIRNKHKAIPQKHMDCGLLISLQACLFLLLLIFIFAHSLQEYEFIHARINSKKIQMLPIPLVTNVWILEAKLSIPNLIFAFISVQTIKLAYKTFKYHKIRVFVCVYVHELLKKNQQTNKQNQTANR